MVSGQHPHRKKGEEQKIAKTLGTHFVAALRFCIPPDDEDAAHHNQGKDTDADKIGELLVCRLLIRLVPHRPSPRINNTEENRLAVVGSCFHTLRNSERVIELPRPSRVCIEWE